MFTLLLLSCAIYNLKKTESYILSINISQIIMLFEILTITQKKIINS